MTPRDRLSSMVKYSRLQSAEEPRRRNCSVIALPDFCFHSQTFSTNFSRPEIVARDVLGIELAFNHDLRGDAGVVGAWNKYGVVAAHAVIANQAVHDGLVEGVAHVQRAGDVRWRELDDKGLAGVFRCGWHVLAAFEVTLAFPFGVPA